MPRVSNVFIDSSAYTYRCQTSISITELRDRMTGIYVDIYNFSMNTLCIKACMPTARFFRRSILENPLYTYLYADVHLEALNMSACMPTDHISCQQLFFKQSANSVVLPYIDQINFVLRDSFSTGIRFLYLFTLRSS
jgi:hypothetical protein